MAKRTQKKLGGRFEEIDIVAEHNTRKVMEAFQNHRVSEACFAGTTGYGYDDLLTATITQMLNIGAISPSLTQAQLPQVKTSLVPY